MGRIVKTATLIAIVTALAFSFVPAAEAQTIPVCATTPTGATLAQKGVTLTPNSPEIAPITGQTQIQFKWEYSMESASSTLEQIQVNFQARSDKAWAAVTLGSSATYVIFDPNEQNKKTDVIATVMVTVSADAPAFDRAAIQVTASALPGTCVKAAPSDSQQTQITAGFYENYQARFQQSIWQAGQNDRLQLPLIIENFGNGPIRVNFRAAEGTSSNLNFALPGPQTVESQRTGDTNQLQIPIDLQTPFKNGYENRRDQLNLEIYGSYAYNGQIGISPLQLQAVVQTQGVYVPGFEAVSMLIAFLGIAILGFVRRQG